jgi:hypothetical protein
MTGSAPQDIAVAFRSFPRRLSSILAGAEDDAQRTSAGPLVGQLEQLVRSAADRMGVAGGDLGAPELAARVADAVEHRPADQWTTDDLEALRAAALEGGNLLRLIERQVAD